MAITPLARATDFESDMNLAVTFVFEGVEPRASPKLSSMTYQVRFADGADIASWDSLLPQNPDGGTMYQASSFATSKRVGGWTPRYFVFEDSSTETVAYALAIERNIFSLGKLWYFPTGPGFIEASQLAAAVPALTAFAQVHGVFLVKVESEILDSVEARSLLVKAGLVKSDNVQPISSTVIVDISSPSDEILRNMPQKGRYAINRAIRDGVTASEVELTASNMKTMFELLAVTGGDAGFAVRTREYYETFWKTYAEKGQGKLYFAYFEGSVVAGAYTGSLGIKAWYKDGASIRNRKAYGASHLLQWQIIQDYCAEGRCLTYDLMGCPPADQVKNEQHPLYGLGLFKTSLSENVVDRVGTFDLEIEAKSVRKWNRWGYRIAAKVNRVLRKEVYF